MTPLSRIVSAFALTVTTTMLAAPTAEAQFPRISIGGPSGVVVGGGRGVSIGGAYGVVGGSGRGLRIGGPNGVHVGGAVGIHIGSPPVPINTNPSYQGTPGVHPSAHQHQSSYAAPQPVQRAVPQYYQQRSVQPQSVQHPSTQHQPVQRSTRNTTTTVTSSRRPSQATVRSQYPQPERAMFGRSEIVPEPPPVPAGFQSVLIRHTRLRDR